MPKGRQAAFPEAGQFSWGKELNHISFQTSSVLHLTKASRLKSQDFVNFVLWQGNGFWSQQPGLQKALRAQARKFKIAQISSNPSPSFCRLCPLGLVPETLRRLHWSCLTLTESWKGLGALHPPTPQQPVTKNSLHERTNASSFASSSQGSLMPRIRLRLCFT